MQTRDVPFRIVRTRFKLLYFVGWVAVGVLLNRLFSPFVPDLVGVVVGHLLFLALVVVAVRSFRGSREPVEQPRAWWRMTGTVRSGIVLAVLFLLVTALSLSEFLSPTHPLTPSHVVSLMIGDLENLVLAALYVNSAARLRRSPDPIIPKPVTLAEPLNGLD